jgi:hypothetical protein
VGVCLNHGVSHFALLAFPAPVISPLRSDVTLREICL